MLGLQVVVAVGLAVLGGQVVARRIGVATPIVLVAAGVLLTVIPALRGIELPAEAVLVLFLPALLFWESLTTSAREIRRFIRSIVLTGTLLVVATAAAVAAVGHSLGLSWETAWIIGAAVAPTDATAVAALGRVLPRGRMTVLRAESLINDGTALVVYGLALGLVTGSAEITTGHVTGLFARSFLGGIAVGLLVGRLIFEARRRMADPLLNNVVTVLTPFVLYLLAEEMHASGVLAVVTCGLLWARMAPRVISAHTRQQSTSFWTLTTFLLNGGLFVLIGLELPVAVQNLSASAVGSAVGTGMLVTVAVYLTTLVVRLVFLNISIGVIRALDRRPQQRQLRTTARGRVVSTVAGFRGGVSLAVALSVPSALPGLGGSSARDMIVFVTAGVVVTSLVVQGLALPRVIRWAQMPEDLSEDEEVALAAVTATREALARIPELAAQTEVGQEVVDAVRQEYQDHLATKGSDEASDDAVQRHDQYTRLRLAMIASRRETLVRLRDQGTIDDTVLRRIQARLDVEEVRLLGPVELD